MIYIILDLTPNYQTLRRISACHLLKNSQLVQTMKTLRFQFPVQIPLKKPKVFICHHKKIPLLFCRAQNLSQIHQHRKPTKICPIRAVVLDMILIKGMPVIIEVQSRSIGFERRWRVTPNLHMHKKFTRLQILTPWGVTNQKYQHMANPQKGGG